MKKEAMKRSRKDWEKTEHPNKPPQPQKPEKLDKEKNLDYESQ